MRRIQVHMETESVPAYGCTEPNEFCDLMTSLGAICFIHAVSYYTTTLSQGRVVSMKTREKPVNLVTITPRMMPFNCRSNPQLRSSNQNECMGQFAIK
jgi:hypothetical protein